MFGLTTKMKDFKVDLQTDRTTNNFSKVSFLLVVVFWKFSIFAVVTIMFWFLLKPGNSSLICETLEIIYASIFRLFKRLRCFFENILLIEMILQKKNFLISPFSLCPRNILLWILHLRSISSNKSLFFASIFLTHCDAWL